MNEKVVMVPGVCRVHLIPKVASASIYQAFKNDKRHHLAPASDDGGDYRWAAIRHPLDRLVSLWSYFCRGNGLKGQPQVAKLGYYHGMGLEEFFNVMAVRGWENIHTRQQAEFLCGHEPDHLAPFERLQDEWDVFRARFPGLKIMRELPRVHPSRHAHWSDYFTPALRRRAELLFADDMTLHERATRHG